ncbi:hypothetical protein BVRB_041710, partial [Beta vulgaris subsp. vulgaris]
ASVEVLLVSQRKAEAATIGFADDRRRSDIGPAKAVATREDRYAAQRGATAAALSMSGLAPQVREEDLSESNYDAFSGYGGSLFDASTPYDAEDREADNIYESVDK